MVRAAACSFTILIIPDVHAQDYATKCKISTLQIVVFRLPVWPSCCLLEHHCVHSPPTQLDSSHYLDSWIWFVFHGYLGKLVSDGRRYQSLLDVAAWAHVRRKYISRMGTNDLMGIDHKSTDFTWIINFSWMVPARKKALTIFYSIKCPFLKLHFQLKVLYMPL